MEGLMTSWYEASLLLVENREPVELAQTETTVIREFQERHVEFFQQRYKSSRWLKNTSLSFNR